MIKLYEIVIIKVDFFGTKKVTAEIIKKAKGTFFFIARIIFPAYLSGGQITKSTEDIIQKKN